MEMSQIRYFIAVSETLNFTRAAEQCCISQPALTKGIKKLESIIGGELLYRTKNSVELSELGRLLLPNFKDIYWNAKHTKEQAQRILSCDALLIKIGFQCSIAFDLICQMLEKFRGQQRDVDIAYLECGPEELDDKLKHHEVDLLFGSRVSGSGEYRKNDICSEKFVVVFSSKHAFVNRDILYLKDLGREKLLLREHCESSNLVLEQLNASGDEPRGICYSRRDDWIPNFVEGDGGIAVVPRSLAISYRLPYLLLKDFPMYQHIYAQRRSGVEPRRQPYLDSLFFSLVNNVFSSESVA